MASPTVDFIATPLTPRDMYTKGVGKARRAEVWVGEGQWERESMGKLLMSKEGEKEKMIKEIMEVKKGKGKMYEGRKGG